MSKRGTKREQGRRRGAARMALEGPMTIYEAVARKQALLDALEGAQALRVDLSGVTEMDTAGIQILVLAKREANKAGKALHLDAHSPATLDAMDLFALGGYFGDSVVMPSTQR